MNTKPLRILSRVSFLLGILTGLALTVVAIWNNLESSSYYFTGARYARFRGLHCPLLISPKEKGTVTAIFNNPSREKDDFFYRATVSGELFSTRQMEDKVTVLPQDSKTVRFSVDANDVDLEFFILARIMILPNSMHPSQEAVCGIMVIDILGLKGVQVSQLAVFLSFLGLAIGLGLWQQTDSKADRDLRYIVPALGFVVLMAMLTAALGWWTLAIGLTVITILLLVIFLRFTVA